ncbi:MAG TPA: PIN domain-containing protein [Chitinophagaceae bacterium]|nr:PIN domain-containing protein [Chitinophagaceae bacterium]
MAENKLFLDTNIILDFLLAREGELTEIEDILNAASKGHIECYISESILATSIYFLEKEKRKNIMQMLRNVWPFLKVLPFDHSVLYSSLEIFDDLGDGLLFFLAQFHKMDFVITRNIKDFKNAPLALPVLTPAQYIKLSK